MRKMITATIVVALSAASAAFAAFPERPIKMIVPWAAGGDTDNIFRPFGQALQKQIGQTRALDDMPGVLCERGQVWPLSLNSSVNIQLPKRGKIDRVQLRHGIPDLPVGVGQLLSAHLWLHDRPLLPWNMRLDQISPRPGLVGHVDRQDLGHGDGGTGGDETVKHGRPVK